MRRSRSTILLSALLSLIVSPLLAQQLPELELVVDGLDSPVAVTHAGDARLFVTQQDGQLVIVRDGELLAAPFLDIDDRVTSAQNEQGLLSVAFHPDYPANGLFFVNYTALDGDTTVARYSVSNDPDRADRDSEAVLLDVDQPFGNHNGGQLQFGPDGFLYIGMGDGGSGNDPSCFAQRQDSLLGKLLRIDVDRNRNQPPFHAIPADNPFVGAGSFPEEAWAVGLRNPWRFAFDRTTGDLYLGDVGQSAREEIDFQPASSSGGENYGWKVMEGNLCLGSIAGCPGPVPGCNAPEYTPPILEYTHADGCSVTGGYVYRGGDIPGLRGWYLYGDFCSGRLWAARREGGTWQQVLLPLTLTDLTSFGEDVDGELYLVERGGELYRLRSAEPAMPGTLELTAATLSVGEGAGTATVRVRRVGGSQGTVGVDYTTADGSAVAGLDYQMASGTLSWTDGEEGVRRFEVPILEDGEVEGVETVDLSLSRPTGGATLGRQSARLEIEDNDLQSGPCVPGPITLCLNDGRFRVEIAWRSRAGETAAGEAVPLTEETGYFWFFEEENVEVVVKVLDACVDPFNRFWVFAAGLTNLATELVVVDTDTGARQVYTNVAGEAFAPVLDLASFSTCP